MTTNFEQQIADDAQEVLDSSIELDPRQLAYYAHLLCASDQLNKPHLVPLLTDIASDQRQAALEAGRPAEAGLYLSAKSAIRIHNQKGAHSCSEMHNIVKDIKTAIVSQLQSGTDVTR